jgi:type III pantothenate kinase
MAAELAPSDPDSVTIIATGGLAPLVINEVAVIDAYEPWLTLIGLRLTYERNTDRGPDRGAADRSTGALRAGSDAAATR